MTIFQIEKKMFDCVGNHYLEVLVELVLETFRYIDYYKVKSFDWLIDKDVDILLNNLDDYFEIVERITSLLFNSSLYATVVLKVLSFCAFLIYKVIAIKETVVSN
jgi:hypothetical protein